MRFKGSHNFMVLVVGQNVKVAKFGRTDHKLDYTVHGI